MPDISSHPKLLLKRLDQISHSLAQFDPALALLGLGSCGLEQHRLDDYSDLDFFVIVQPGHKQRFIEQLDWLEQIQPVAYCLRNTADGYKLLFDDGVFCEFAVFEPAELAAIPFAPGQILWQRPEFDAQITQPRLQTAPSISTDEQWLVGEAITCLYVGLGRFHRGERLSAHRFIHQYAFERILELCQLKQPDQGPRDPFVYERRLEQRQPELAAQLALMQQGIDQCPESALAQLAYLQQHHQVNAAMRIQIMALCQRR